MDSSNRAHLPKTDFLDFISGFLGLTF
jgi:hypothetical protein